MKRFLIFVLLVCLLLLQEALLRIWQLTGLVPNLLLIFVFYTLFYRFKYSYYLVLVTGWFLDIHSISKFGIFMISLGLTWLLLVWYSNKLVKQFVWWRKLNFLIIGSLSYSLLTWLLLSWSYLNWQSFSLGLIRSSLAIIIPGILIWPVFDYFKVKYWREEELRISI